MITRFSIRAKPWDYRSADLLIKESETGDWVQYSDVSKEIEEWKQVSRDWRYRAETAEAELTKLRKPK